MARSLRVILNEGYLCRHIGQYSRIDLLESNLNFDGGLLAVGCRDDLIRLSRQLFIPERIEGQITPRDLEAQAAPTLPPKKATPDQSSVPDNFPEGVPIPEGSHVMAVQSLANDAHNVIFATEGDTPQIFDLYKKSMGSSGWGHPTQEYQGKEQSFLSFKKGDTITNISVSKDPKSGQRIIAVMYYEEKPLPFPEF